MRRCHGPGPDKEIARPKEEIVRISGGVTAEKRNSVSTEAGRIKNIGGA